MDPATIEAVKARIISKFPRASADFSTIMDSEIETWIAELADAFPFWFLTMYPGTSMQNLFPFTTVDLTHPAPIAGRWIDVGWLIVQPGVSVYDIYAPLEDSEAANPTWWHPVKVNMVDYIYEFTNNGQFISSLPIPEYEDCLAFISYKKTARPQQVTWRSDEAKSQLVFSPTPDKYYIYAVQFSIKNPPNYVDGLVTRNRFLTNAPGAVMAKGMLEAARFFDEAQLVDKWESVLYGQPLGTEGISNVGAVGGILGRLKKETIRRGYQAREQVQSYRSMALATGSNLGMSQSRFRFGNYRYRSGRWW